MRTYKEAHELQAQLKQRGYSSRATSKILKWYAVGDCEVHETLLIKKIKAKENIPKRGENYEESCW